MVVVAAPDGKQVGAISGDNQRLLFVSRTEDRGANYSALYTYVKMTSRADGGGAPTTLVAGTTSCADCVFDSFITPDGTFALVLDPIDNAQSAAADDRGARRRGDRHRQHAYPCGVLVRRHDVDRGRVGRAPS